MGSGHGGKNLGHNYYALGPLKLISDKNGTVPGQLQVQYSQVDTCLALNEILSRDDIQDQIMRRKKGEMESSDLEKVAYHGSRRDF